MTNGETCFQNGERCYSGKNYEEAVRWYRLGSQQNHAKCQNMLGICYYTGNGVPQDYAEAVRWFRSSAALGWHVAQNNLGNCCYNGKGTAQNYAEAVRWYQEASRQGNPDAQNNLGNCYYNGKGVARDYAQAVTWYQAAARQGHAWANYNLANCCYNGEGAAQNYTEAVRYYTAAAQKGNMNAQNALGNCFYNGRGVAQNFAEAVKWYDKAVKQGYHWAQYNLANCYYDGRGVARNYAEAVRLYTAAAQQGNADAQNALGNCLYSGNGTEKNYEEAVRWYQASARQGHQWAQYNLANCYYNGKGVPRDYGEAVKLYELSARQGNGDAQNRLGLCYHWGNGVEKDHAESARWFLESARSGFHWGQNNIANSYYNGDGVEQNFEEAVKWYAAAARQGNSESQNSLANCYYAGRGVAQDYAEAVRWYTESANQGYAWAQNNLGNCYYNGKGVAQDYAEAVRWYTEAARQGNSEAQNNLGNCYYNGKGTERNYAEAVKWYTKAAREGHAWAQCNLAYCYRNGLGVEQDLQEAARWYRESARQGNETAQEGLRALEADPVSEEKGNESGEEAVTPARTGDKKDNQSLEELLAELEEMTGLAGVKQQVRTQVAQIRVEQMAREKGLDVSKAEMPSRHMVFTGNPGTGKTTVARLLGKIYGALGVLSKGDVFVECTRADLVAEFIGQTAPKVKKKVKEAKGGILFIDEAYSLYRDDDPKDFGKEAIDTLIQCMENERQDLIVILAGYTREMHHMLQHANPGLKSRVRTEIRFEDYSPEELYAIFESMLARQGKHISADAGEETRGLLARLSRDPDFGNARGVRNLMETMLEKQQLRLAGMADFSEEDYFTIRMEDVQAAASAGKIKGRKSVQELLDELDHMVGLDNAKKEIRKRVAAIQVAEMAKKAGVKQGAGTVSPHMVFTGNPGTGKTTVARLVGQIYGAMGILPKGELFVECSRGDLVGTHVGETAPMVQEKVREAMGGVLFIDEAYSLYKSDSGNDFGQEAVDTLIQCMENNRGNLVVILAGYTGEMRDMLQHANPGLKSRISTEVEFDDYTVEEFTKIFRAMLEESGLRLRDDADDALLTELFALCAEDPDFGNARGVRNTLEKVVDARNTRLFEQSQGGTELSREDFETIAPQDVQTVLDEIRARPKKPARPHIGF